MLSVPDLYSGNNEAVKFNIPMSDPVYEHRAAVKMLQNPDLAPGGMASRLVTTGALPLVEAVKNDPFIKQNTELLGELSQRIYTFAVYVSSGGAPSVEALYGLEWGKSDDPKKSVLKLTCNLVPFLAFDLCMSKDAKRNLSRLREQYHDQIEVALRHTKFNWNSLLTRYLPYQMFEDFRIALALLEYACKGREKLSLGACNEVAAMVTDDRRHPMDTLYFAADFPTPDTYERDESIRKDMMKEIIRMVKAGNKNIDNKFKVKAKDNGFSHVISKQAQAGAWLNAKANDIRLGQTAAAYFTLFNEYDSALRFSMLDCMYFFCALTQPLLLLENDALLTSPAAARCASVKKAIPVTADTKDEQFLEDVLEMNGITIDRNAALKGLGKGELNTLTAALLHVDAFKPDSSEPSGVSELALFSALLLQSVATDHMTMRQHLWDDSIKAELLEAEKDALADEVTTLTRANAESAKALDECRSENEALRARIAELEQSIADMETRTEGNKDSMSLIAAFDEDMEDMRTQICELQQANEKLQAENSGLSVKLERMRGDDQPILVHGDEKELFPGEIRDIVLSILLDAYKNGQNSLRETRRMDILEDILEKNPYEGLLERRAEAVKTAFVGYSTMDVPLRHFMEEIGFQFKEVSRKHHKAWYYGDPRYRYTFPASGSDKAREGKNIATELITYFF